MREGYPHLGKEFHPDWEGLERTILRKGTPSRVYHMELFQDPEVRQAIAERFDLADGLDRGDPDFERKLYIRVQRFCGFDYARVGLDDMAVELHKTKTEDLAALRRQGGRTYQDEHTGPITSWEEFERFRWPDPKRPEALRSLEWFQENLPEDMCIVSGSISHFCEYLTWLMGYETFCYALYDQRDLVRAITDRLLQLYIDVLEQYATFDRLRIIFASDDMGYKTGLLFSRDDMIEFVLDPHKEIARRSHDAGRIYLLHSCGNLHEIMDYLIDEVEIDGKHSFEDTIEDVRELKATYGRRTALVGGIDVDFLCRADETAVRERVRETLDICQPGGGYCLGTGNSVTNYIPLEQYLAMLDEGHRYSG